MYIRTYVYIYIYIYILYIYMYVERERERERYRRYTYSVCVYICAPKKKDSQPWSGVRMGLESICLTTWWWFESMNMHIYIYIYIHTYIDMSWVWKGILYFCPYRTDRWAGATLCLFLAPRPQGQEQALRWESGFPSRISLKIVMLCSGYYPLVI